MKHLYLFTRFFLSFRRENNLQKVQCVVLTDGEACPLSRHKLIKRYWENNAEFMGHARHDYWKTILRDRKTGNYVQI